MQHTLVIAFCVLTAALSGCRPGNGTLGSPREATVCQLSQAPSAWNRVVVRVTGVAHYAFENFTLAGATCPEEDQNLTRIWLTYGGRESPRTIYCCPGEGAELTRDDSLVIEGVSLPIEDGEGPSLYRMLRALESTGIFTQTSPGVFGNTPASECLRRNLPGSNWAWIRFTLAAGAPVFEGWRGLMLALQNGRPGFDHVTGQNAWEHMQSNPHTQHHLQRGDAGPERLDQSGRGGIVRLEPFPGHRRYRRRNRRAVIEHPRRASVLPGHSFRSTSGRRRSPERRPDRACRRRLLERSASPGERLRLMRWILHDWSDEESIGLLANVRKVAAPDARLMVVESVIPETPEFDLGKWMDLNMMVMTTGRERTAAEFRDLFERAGFSLEQIVPTSSPLSIVVGKPTKVPA